MFISCFDLYLITVSFVFIVFVLRFSEIAIFYLCIFSVFGCLCCSFVLLWFFALQFLFNSLLKIVKCEIADIKDRSKIVIEASLLCFFD